MDDKIETSQQKAGEISDPGGCCSETTAGAFQYTGEGAPSGVPVQRYGPDQLKTSQQLRREHKPLDSSNYY
jgi:hypothetical protein